MLKPKTHHNQQITTKTKNLLDKLCKKSKLSRPMQLEKIVEDEYRHKKFVSYVENKYGSPNQQKT
jgi:hypothetical protein|tara:strand:+ start:948 stop:1142 length:195 start_codon:yes stop_codon:yes gene_type:complete